jgi:ABC-type lipoprotein export system ATPase subunit
VVITGAVGAGKSSLLSALLGEMLPQVQTERREVTADVEIEQHMRSHARTITHDQIYDGWHGYYTQDQMNGVTRQEGKQGQEEQEGGHSGTEERRVTMSSVTMSSVTVRAPIALCTQIPFVINATLKENVTMAGGGNVDEARYEEAIAAAALAPDIAVLPAGEMTEIGDKGLNLSGGQKQRVSLARAAYAHGGKPKSIVVLDDPLSALDAHVGRHVFESMVMGDGLLRRRGQAVVLVTNQLQLLKMLRAGGVDGAGAECIVVMKGGSIVERGSSYEQLMRGEGVGSRVGTMRELAASLVSQEEAPVEDVQAIAAAPSAVAALAPAAVSVPNEALAATATTADTAATGVPLPLRDLEATLDGAVDGAVDGGIDGAAAAADAGGVAGGGGSGGGHATKYVMRTESTGDKLKGKKKEKGEGELVAAEERHRGAVPMSAYTQYFGILRKPVFVGLVLAGFVVAEVGNVLQVVVIFSALLLPIVQDLVLCTVYLP